MKLLFRSSRARKLFGSDKELRKRFGPRLAELIKRRLLQLRAAEVLEPMRMLPGRCHELTGDREGQFAIDLAHPYRLVFEPDDDDSFRKPDGGWDWLSITRIVVLEVTDYH